MCKGERGIKQALEETAGIKFAVRQFLSDMIDIPSLSGQESDLAERVKTEMNTLSFNEVFEVGGNVCAKKGSGKHTVLFDAHMDVVKPGTGWTSEPFKARINGEYMIGRGACDDKASLAAIIYGAHLAKVPSGMTVLVLASVKEEISEGNGLKDFFDKTGIKPDYVVIAEPSSLRLGRGNRGRLEIRIDIAGIAAHASRPLQGLNAVYRAADIVKSVEQLNERMQADSIAVTKIETSNENINIIPESCSIYCDYRSAPGSDKDKLINELKQLLSDRDRVKEVSPYYMPWILKEDSPLYRAALRTIKENSRLNDEIIIWDFCTNGSFTSGQLGIDTIGFGPGDENEAHTADEKIHLQDVYKAIEFFREIGENLMREIG